MNCVSIDGATVKKLALKRLTKSDVTIFEWHLRNRNAGNRKSINLNADVFVTEMYPSVPTVALTSSPLTVFEVSSAAISTRRERR